MASKEKIEGYAQVKKIENLLKGYHFTLDFYEGLSKIKMLEKEQRDIIENNKRKEVIRRSIEKDKEAQLRANEKDKQAKEAQLRANIINSIFFTDLVKKYYFSKSAREVSLQASISDIFGMVGSLINGKPLPTEDESAENWWRNQLQNSRNTQAGEYLYQLNEQGELMPIVRNYWTNKQQERIQPTISNCKFFNESGVSRKIYSLLAGGSTLTTKSHSKCPSCNWLICSCGSCKKGCSTH